MRVLRRTENSGRLGGWTRGAAAVAATVIVCGVLAAQGPAGAGDFQAYPLQHVAAADVESRLPEVFTREHGPVEVMVDPRTNRLLVRGGPAAQAATRQLIESMDRPAAPAAAPPVLRTYPVPRGDVPALAGRLQEKLGAGVRIVPDARAAQLLVLAPPAAHQQLAAELTAVQQAPVEAPPQPSAATPAERPAAGNVYQLKHLDAARFEAALNRICRQPPSVSTTRDGRVATYNFTSSQGVKSALVVDRASGQVAVEGAPALAGSWLRLLAALDGTALQGRQTSVLPLATADRASVQKVMAALRMAEQPAAAGREPEEGALAQAGQPGPNDPQPGGAQPQRDPADRAQQLRDQLDAAAGDGALIGPVQIEYLEGLDIIVVRGHPRDVERVTEIINDIERLSVDTKPVIELYPLRHAGSDALATMVRQLYEQVLSPRAGRVTITPLVKPNSLLLIGREDSVRTVLDLVRRLDQPVDPASQFKVFPLSHAAAATAQQTVQEFFATRTGLGTRVLVTADVRSNALVVQASPRDLTEVAALIKKLDTPSSAAVNELRIFPLQNSLADDLAAVLQAAVTGQIGTTGRRTGQGAQGIQEAIQGQLQGQPGQGGPFGQGVQGGQQRTGAANQPRSTTLRLLTFDAQGQKQFKSGILTDVRITADARANALVISAPSESMELLAALVKQLDQLPAAEAQVKVFTIVNGDASSLSEMLQNLFGRQVVPGQLGQQFGGGTSNENTLVPLRFSVDQRTNSIIVSGSAGDLNVVEAILLRLDDSDVRQRRSVVYRLKNAPAADVSNAVNELLRSQRQVQQVNPGLISPFEQIEREVIVVPEPVSNSLIVSATPRYFEEIRKIVEDLDARPPMVMIQVLIAEVALNNTDEFGVELGLQDSLLFDRSLLGDLVTTTTTTTFGDPPTTTEDQVIVGASNTPGFNFNNQPLGNSGSDKALSNSDKVAGQGLSHFAVGRINSELGFGGLVLSASSESVSALIRALNECRRMDVISRPQIMTLDNQPAYIQVGQRVPRITNTTFTETGQVNSIDLDNVGLILGVTPRISPDGLVVMEIDAEKSELGAEAEGIPISINNNGQVIRSPRINTTIAQTTVSALSGQTIVLGGLIVKSKSQTHRRVPLLADIPILGHLFRYDSTVGRKSELLIIMTPRVVRNERDAELIKQVETARMNWCLADVVKLHGDASLRGRVDEWADGETITVYPDRDPSGNSALPIEVVPAPGEVYPGEMLPDGSVVPGTVPREGPPGSNPLRSDPGAPPQPLLDGPAERESRRSAPRPIDPVDQAYRQRLPRVMPAQALARPGAPRKVERATYESRPLPPR